jgi:hypothetical protein
MTNYEILDLVFSGLSALVIGGAAILFGIQQHKIEKHKRDDFLYEKRFNVYIEINSIIKDTLAHELHVSKWNDKEAEKFFKETEILLCKYGREVIKSQSKIKMLFSDNELDKKIDLFSCIFTELVIHMMFYNNNYGDGKEKEFCNIKEKSQELMIWYAASELDKHFARYLKMDR